MKIGDLVIMPSYRDDPYVVGVVVDVTTRADDNRVGVNWPDTEHDVEFEPISWLEIIDNADYY